MQTPGRNGASLDPDPGSPAGQERIKAEAPMQITLTHDVAPCLPEEPNSDGWISFCGEDPNPYSLDETSAFRLPEDASPDDRTWDAAGINVFPQELEAESSWMHQILLYSLFIHAKPPAEEAADSRALAARAAVTGNSESNSDAEIAGAPTPDFAREEHAKIAKIWQEIAANKVTTESVELVLNRLDMRPAWNLLADKLLENSEVRAVERIHQDVQRLVRGMCAGKQSLGEMYVDLIITLIHQLNNLGANQKPLVDKLASRRVRWPALTAAHPSYRLYENPPESLGAAYPFRMDKASRWRPDKHPDQVALHLAFFMHRLKQAVTNFAKQGQHPPTRFSRSLQDVLALQSLPEAVDDWWRAALGHFSAAYPEPETDSRFTGWLTADSHRKSPKEMRRRIHQKLREAFVSVLGGNKIR